VSSILRSAVAFSSRKGPLGLGEQVKALPHAATATGRDLDALQATRSAPWQDRRGRAQLLNLDRHPVRMRTFGARQAVDQSLGSISLA
jgi:hypothetical protein